MVGPARLELATSPLSGVRSNHLSYEPDILNAVSRTFRNMVPQYFTGKRDTPTAVLDVSKKRKIPNSILRKEVIQPHVPVRLPCYDFTPVADPTVVGCLRS